MTNRQLLVSFFLCSSLINAAVSKPARSFGSILPLKDRMVFRLHTGRIPSFSGNGVISWKVPEKNAQSGFVPSFAGRNRMLQWQGPYEMTWQQMVHGVNPMINWKEKRSDTIAKILQSEGRFSTVLSAIVSSYEDTSDYTKEVICTTGYNGCTSFDIPVLVNRQNNRISAEDFIMGACCRGYESESFVVMRVGMNGERHVVAWRNKDGHIKGPGATFDDMQKAHHIELLPMYDQLEEFIKTGKSLWR